MSSPYPGLDSQSLNKDWAARGIGLSRIKLLQAKAQRTGSGSWVEGPARLRVWTGLCSGWPSGGGEQGSSGRGRKAGFYGLATTPSLCLLLLLSISSTVCLSSSCTPII